MKLDAPAEEWLDVLGWEGSYQISDRGSLRSLPRRIIRSNGTPQTFRGRILSPAPSHGGYLGYVLKIQGHFKRLYIHQMMLEAFVGPRPSGMQARHLDGDNQHNHLANLAWGTKLENEHDKLLHGTDQKSIAGTICKRGHLLRAPNRLVKKPGASQGQCRACSNAHSYVRYHKLLKSDLPAIADRYYERIMSSEVAAA